jgi:hypothetical protein
MFAEATNTSGLLLEGDMIDEIMTGKMCKDPLRHSSSYAYGSRGKSASQFRQDQEQLFLGSSFAP